MDTDVGPSGFATIDARAHPGRASSLTHQIPSAAGHSSPCAAKPPDLLAHLPRTPLPPPRAGRTSRSSGGATSSPPHSPRRRKSRTFSTWSLATSVTCAQTPAPKSPAPPSAVDEWEDQDTEENSLTSLRQPLSDPVQAPTRLELPSPVPSAGQASLPNSLPDRTPPGWDSPHIQIPSPSLTTGEPILLHLERTPPLPDSSSLTSNVFAEPDPDALARADREAQQAWDEDPTLVPREEIVLWLGRPVTASLSEAEVTAAQTAYMAHFDFKKDRIDEALRKLCAKLLVRAETQVLDRVLRAFAARFSAAHPWGLYRSEEVVHHLAYSILLLNTDIHVADAGERMTRAQFVRNTLRSLEEESGSSSRASTDDMRHDTGLRRTSSVSGASRHSRAETSDQVWSSSMERLLKVIYHAVRSEPIRQPTWSGEVLGSPALVPRAQNSSRRTSIRGLPSLLTASSIPTRRRSEPGPDARPPIQPGAPVGFVTSLNQTMIPEELDTEARASDTNAREAQASGVVQDAELALVGPPWAKEGRLARKLIEPKRNKDKSWTEVFAVVHAPGVLSLFRFASSSKHDTKVVGGGNWALNAEKVDEVGLQQALAQAVPPLSLSKNRPYVVFLHLPNRGSMYLQTAHEGLVTEWCATLNYWAARTSQAPLAAGVTSVDYGWNVSDPAAAQVDVGEESDKSLLTPSRGEVGDPLSLTVSDWGSSASLLGQIKSSTGHTSLTVPDEEETQEMFRSVSLGTPSRRGLMGWGRSLRGLGSRVTGETGPVDFTAVQSKSVGRTPSPALGWQVQAGDKVFPHERIPLGTWAAPPPPSGRSTLSDLEQEKALSDFLLVLEAELASHQGVRGLIQARFHPWGANAAQARANWERKLGYLLDELAKYRCFVSSLAEAREKRARLVRKDGMIIDSRDEEDHVSDVRSDDS